MLSSKTSSYCWHSATTVGFFVFFLASSLPITVSYPSYISVSSLSWPNINPWVSIRSIFVVLPIWYLLSVTSSVSLSVLHTWAFVWVIIVTFSLTHTFSSFLPSYNSISYACLSPIWSLSSWLFWSSSSIWYQLSYFLWIYSISIWELIFSHFNSCI